MGGGNETYEHAYKRVFAGKTQCPAGENARTHPFSAVILVGDATVGKTHLLSRYVRGTLPKAPQSTIGVEFSTRMIQLKTGGTVKAQIWDTAGQERYRSITTAHYRRSVGALLLYDVTRKQTFLNAAKWLDDLRQSGEPDIVVMLVGNKIDILEKEPGRREVQTDQASSWAQRNGLFFAEASAVTGERVKELFETLLQEIYNRKNERRAGEAAAGDGAGAVQLSGGVAVTGWNARGTNGEQINMPGGGTNNPFFSCCTNL